MLTHEEVRQVLADRSDKQAEALHVFEGERNFSMVRETLAVTRLVKLFSFNFVCPKIILRQYFFYENLLDEIKANYGRLLFSSYYNL